MEKNIVLKKLSVLEYMLAYRKDIRVLMDWNTLKKAKINTGVMLVNKDNKDTVYHCWSDDDTLMGPRKKVKFKFKKNMFVRVPAVKYKNRVILLDGNHRLSELYPKFICIDYIDCKTEKDKRIFVDLL
jgi:hypothetical protein